jgi:hypothetical protein
MSLARRHNLTLPLLLVNFDSTGHNAPSLTYPQQPVGCAGNLFRQASRVFYPIVSRYTQPLIATRGGPRWLLAVAITWMVYVTQFLCKLARYLR